MNTGFTDTAHNFCNNNYLITFCLPVPNTIQLNLQLQPPLLSNQFSKMPKVFKSNNYVWNLL